MSGYKARGYYPDDEPLTAFSLDQYARMKAKGFRDTERSMGDTAALIHSEVTEMYEEWRRNKPPMYYGEDGKPEGSVFELVDILLRVADEFGHLVETGVISSVDEVVAKKIAHNETRPHRHGDKRS